MENQKISFKPIDDQVLIKLPESVGETASGLVIPGEPVSVNRAVVIVVGPDATQVVAGDPIMLPNHIGVEIKLEGGVFQLIKQSDIYGVL